MFNFIRFWWRLNTTDFPRVHIFDAEDPNEEIADGFINIQYVGVVNEAGLDMPAHKYLLTFQRKPGAKFFARNLYNFDQDRYREDMRMALKKMRHDIYAYYKKLRRS